MPAVARTRIVDEGFCDLQKPQRWTCPGFEAFMFFSGLCPRNGFFSVVEQRSGFTLGRPRITRKQAIEGAMFLLSKCSPSELEARIEEALKNPNTHVKLDPAEKVK